MNLNKSLIWICNRGKPSISMELGNRATSRNEAAEDFEISFYTPSFIKVQQHWRRRRFWNRIISRERFCKRKYQFV